MSSALHNKRFTLHLDSKDRVPGGTPNNFRVLFGDKVRCAADEQITLDLYDFICPYTFPAISHSDKITLTFEMIMNLYSDDNGTRLELPFWERTGNIYTAKFEFGLDDGHYSTQSLAAALKDKIDKKSIVTSKYPLPGTEGYDPTSPDYTWNPYGITTTSSHDAVSNKIRLSFDFELNHSTDPTILPSTYYVAAHSTGSISLKIRAGSNNRVLGVSSADLGYSDLLEDQHPHNERGLFTDVGQLVFLGIDPNTNLTGVGTSANGPFFPIDTSRHGLGQPALGYITQEFGTRPQGFSLPAQFAITSISEPTDAHPGGLVNVQYIGFFVTYHWSFENLSLMSPIPVSAPIQFNLKFHSKLPCNLTPNHTLFLHCDLRDHNLGTAENGGVVLSNVLARIPILVAPFNTIYYRSETTEYNSMTVPFQHLDSLHLRVTNDRMQPIEMLDDLECTFLVSKDKINHRGDEQVSLLKQILTFSEKIARYTTYQWLQLKP